MEGQDADDGGCHKDLRTKHGSLKIQNDRNTGDIKHGTLEARDDANTGRCSHVTMEELKAGHTGRRKPRMLDGNLRSW